jgi:hypothetical protein
MRSEELRSEIASMEKQRNELSEKLDDLLGKTRPEIAEKARLWINRHVEDRVKYHPKVITSLGLEGVRALKSCIADLCTSVPSLVLTATEDEDTWPHRPAQAGLRGFSYGNDYFDSIFRKVINNLGPILEKYKLLDDPPGHYQSWRKRQDGRIEYAISTSFGVGQDTALRSYSENYQAFERLENAINDKRKELTGASASELWDSA